MEYNIDSHKLHLHPERVSQWTYGHDIYPLYVEISPVGYCNHRCSFCALDFRHQKCELDINKLKDCIRRMGQRVDGVKSIMFAGEGEPLLYKHLPEAIKTCSEYKIKTSLTTNLSRRNNNDYETYIKHCSWIKVSINGGDKETYKKIHGVNDYDKVWENIIHLLKLREEMKSICTIGLQILLLDDNYDSIENLIIKAAHHKVDYVVIKPYSQQLSSFTTKYKNIDYKMFKGLKDKLMEYNAPEQGFQVIFREETMKRWDQHKHNYNKCRVVPYFWAYIEATGDVYGCSCFLGDNKFVLGNIHNDDWNTVWMDDPEDINDKKLGLKLYMRDEHDISKCRINCRMNFANEYLHRLKNPDAHDDFI